MAAVDGSNSYLRFSSVSLPGVSNEDRYYYNLGHKTNVNVSSFGVFDGHNGNFGSEYCLKKLHEMVIETFVESYQNAFHHKHSVDTNDLIRSEMKDILFSAAINKSVQQADHTIKKSSAAGTAMNSVYVTKQLSNDWNTIQTHCSTSIICSNVGDCRAIMIMGDYQEHPQDPNPQRALAVTTNSNSSHEIIMENQQYHELQVEQNPSLELDHQIKSPANEKLIEPSTTSSMDIYDTHRQFNRSFDSSNYSSHVVNASQHEMDTTRHSIFSYLSSTSTPTDSVHSTPTAGHKGNHRKTIPKKKVGMQAKPSTTNGTMDASVPLIEHLNGTLSVKCISLSEDHKVSCLREKFRIQNKLNVLPMTFPYPIDISNIKSPFHSLFILPNLMKKPSRDDLQLKSDALYPSNASSNEAVPILIVLDSVLRDIKSMSNTQIDELDLTMHPMGSLKLTSGQSILFVFDKQSCVFNSGLHNQSASLSKGRHEMDSIGSPLRVMIEKSLEDQNVEKYCANDHDYDFLVKLGLSYVWLQSQPTSVVTEFEHEKVEIQPDLPIVHEDSFIAHRRTSDGKHIGPLAFFGRYDVSVMMTRSIGDILAPRGCYPHPEHTMITLPRRQHARIIMASDGLWDVVTNEDIRRIAMCHRFKDPIDFAIHLAEKAKRRRTKRFMRQDDVTVMVIDIHPEYAMFVADKYQPVQSYSKLHRNSSFDVLSNTILKNFSKKKYHRSENDLSVFKNEGSGHSRDDRMIHHPPSSSTLIEENESIHQSFDEKPSQSCDNQENFGTISRYSIPPEGSCIIV